MSHRGWPVVFGPVFSIDVREYNTRLLFKAPPKKQSNAIVKAKTQAARAREKWKIRRKCSYIFLAKNGANANKIKPVSRTFQTTLVRDVVFIGVDS